MKIPSGGILGRTSVPWEDDQPAGTVGDDGTEGVSSTALADAMASEEEKKKVEEEWTRTSPGEVDI